MAAANTPGLVIHLTQDGVLQPIGYSQVVRPMLGLAAQGVPQALVSLERLVDLKDHRRVSALRQKLADAGILWIYRLYRYGAVNYLGNAARMTAAALEILREARVSVIHARGLVVGTTALFLRALTGAPILYDIRGFWLDHRIESDKVFAHRYLVYLARRLEAAIYARASAVVSLTEIGVDVIRSGYFGRLNPSAITVCIPTCVDYDSFRLRGSAGLGLSGPRKRLENKLVFGFVGSINRDYCTPEAFRLFRYAHEINSDTILLCLSEQETQIRDAAMREGIPVDALVIHRATHDEMPQWLPLIDWGFLMLYSHFSKTASMPTKLGEFFAAGVRPIYHGCNTEVGAWVDHAGSGYRLPDLSDQALRIAARAVVTTNLDQAVVAEARVRSRGHFSLESGIRRYHDVIRALAASNPTERSTSPSGA